jgi:hypothetical protein
MRPADPAPGGTAWVAATACEHSGAVSSSG